MLITYPSTVQFSYRKSINLLILVMTTLACGTPPGVETPKSAITHLSAGGNHSCAVSEGVVRCWGYNSQQQLEIPESVFAPSELSSGEYYNCAVVESELQCWGNPPELPSDLVSPSLLNPRGIANGNTHACAITDSGLRCWGGNNYGQSDVPNDLLYVTMVAAGYNHTCAIADGTVRCWGISDNSTADVDQIEVPTSVNNPLMISANFNSSCVVTGDGVQCWGANNFGQSDVPVDLMNPTEIAVGLYHACAVTDDGVRCWGANSETVNWGQLEVPPGLVNPRNLSAGSSHTCAITDEGVKCWGRNISGQVDVPLLGPGGAFKPPAGPIRPDREVQLDHYPAATLYYTLDGSTPTTSSLLYVDGITVSENQTISVLPVTTEGEQPIFTGNFTIDTDDDGVNDADDNCLNAVNPFQENNYGTALGDACEDVDNDFINDDVDNCPEVSNFDQANRVGTDLGDACEDTDGDSITDLSDNCALVSNVGQDNTYGAVSGDACEDIDGDAIFDDVDNCPYDVNPLQEDLNSNSIGDTCEDNDFDNDGVDDGIDNCMARPNPTQDDWNIDGVGDKCDSPDVDETELLRAYEEATSLMRCHHRDLRNGNDECTGTTGFVGDIEHPCPEGGSLLWHAGFNPSLRLDYKNCGIQIANGKTVFVDGAYEGFISYSGTGVFISEAPNYMTVTGYDYRGAVHIRRYAYAARLTPSYNLSSVASIWSKVECQSAACSDGIVRFDAIDVVGPLGNFQDGNLVWGEPYPATSWELDE